MATQSDNDLQAQEIAAIVNEIRDRVRARHPQGEAKGLGVALPDLLPILHARDRAEAKVAAIGSVNPRPGGPLNSTIQFVKRNIARGLNWFVRDQVDFNRAVLGALEATLESLNEANRTFSTIGGRLDDLQTRLNGTDTQSQELADIRSHWQQWREDWQSRIVQNEVRYLRGLSELQASLDFRLARLDTNWRDSLAAHATQSGLLHNQYQDASRRSHEEYQAELRRATDELQQRFWSDLEKVRREYEALIHNELRVIRQKAFASPAQASTVPPAAQPATEVPLDIDYNRFSDRFRGNETYVRGHQQFYIPYFKDCRNVLDIGCGRGEFLELCREANIPARGLDLDEESVAICRSKGLEAEAGNAFTWLADQPDGAFDGIFASQVIEHLTPAQVPQLVKLCAQKLRTGGVLALETPNPECLAIFATHFYLDPTHQRPVPPSLLVFYYEEYGLGSIQVHRLSPAAESMPSLNELPAAFREAFFGGLDYCAIARKL